MGGYGDLAIRMKRYEQAARHTLPPRQYAIARIDGRNFHAWTRGCDKPFDYTLMDAFEATARHVVEQMHGSVLAYHQSDEISVVLQDFATHGTEPWLGGVVQKQASVAASMATAHFNACWSLTHPEDPPSTATFDGRVFTIPTLDEAVNYLIWRQQDATRNSVNMAASAHFSHKSLHGMNSTQRQTRLRLEADVDWDDYPTRAKRGTVTHRESYTEDVTYTRKDTGALVTQPNVTRSHVVTDQDPPTFTAQAGRGYLTALLDVEAGS